jgi:hypothetical protein
MILKGRRPLKEVLKENKEKLAAHRSQSKQLIIEHEPQAEEGKQP